MDQDWSRRGVVAAMAGAGTAGLADTAGAQASITTPMIIPEASDFLVGDDYGGYFVHLGDQAAADLEPNQFEGCEFDSLSLEGITQYNSTLIDRLEERHRETEVKAYVPRSADVKEGTLWVIDKTVECPSEYVGLQTERIGSGFVVGNASAEDGATETGEGVGLPGFGPLPALAAVVAGGYALARRAAED